MIAGICQRIITEKFPEISHSMDALGEVLRKFYEKHLRKQFGHEDFVFDCYVTSQQKVKSVADRWPDCVPVDPEEALTVVCKALVKLCIHSS